MKKNWALKRMKRMFLRSVTDPLADLRSALDGKLTSGVDAQVRVPDPAGNAQKGVL